MQTDIAGGICQSGRSSAVACLTVTLSERNIKRHSRISPSRNKPNMTIIVHHLDKSRSHRILWLLEELNVPYEIKAYQRNKETMLAPPELKKIHPLGKSPVIENTETKEIVAESGAIVEVPPRLAG
jgi:hypothetical protein